MSIIIDDAGVNGADGKNVYVGNLSWETDDAQLLELVSQYGTGTSAHVETSKSGRSLGYGLVVGVLYAFETLVDELLPSLTEKQLSAIGIAALAAGLPGAVFGGWVMDVTGGWMGEWKKGGWMKGGWVGMWMKAP